MTAGAPPESQTYDVHRDEDSLWCAGRGRRLAEQLGFDEQGGGAIAIAISELVSNAIKFAGRGTLTLRPLHAPRPGLEVTVQDDGPGIEDFAKALQDGFSEGRMISDDAPKAARPRRGLGAGLGAVMRLMDELETEVPFGGGLIIKARKYLPGD
ncbi:MAG: ATP-binding protein [bacterium]